MKKSWGSMIPSLIIVPALPTSQECVLIQLVKVSDIVNKT